MPATKDKGGETKMKTWKKGAIIGALYGLSLDISIAVNNEISHLIEPLYVPLLLTTDVGVSLGFSWYLVFLWYPIVGSLIGIALEFLFEKIRGER